MKLNLSDVDLILDTFISKSFGKNFKFRKNQRETIKDIISFYASNKNGLYLLDAPTGTGKSIIAICVAGVLNYYNKDGYILTSELSLQDQYKLDFDLNKIDWGSIKGQNNYHCSKNGEMFSSGWCKQRNMSKAHAKELPCYADCGYYKTQDKAIDTQTSLLNYSYWLLHMNYVKEKLDVPMFTERDFVICDEAHKLVDIVQDHFKPEANDKFTDSLIKYIDLVNRKLNTVNITLSPALITRTFDNLIINEGDLFSQFESLEKAHEILKILNSNYNKVKVEISNIFKQNSGDWEDRTILYLAENIKDSMIKYEDYIQITKNTGVENIIKCKNEKNVEYKSINEGYLMNNHFFKHTKFKLFMSATIGDPETFIKNINYKGVWEYKKIDSNFNFEKSPIYVYVKHKLNYDNKEKQSIWTAEMVNKILNKHKNEQGIIHTASFWLAETIFSNLSYKNKKRVRLYGDSKEKQNTIDEMGAGVNDTVLMGPSLLEGLDMKDERSRFQAFAKIPYLNLRDEYVKAKMYKDDDWYKWKAIIAILQGTGRIVRHKEDYGITYFLDGKSLMDLYYSSRNSFPDKEFVDRLKIIKT